MPQHVEQPESGQGIVLDRLSAGYHKQLIIDEISLTIPLGKMSVLVGANGSGKSTLLSTIARMLKPLGGSVLLDGVTAQNAEKLVELAADAEHTSVRLRNCQPDTMA